MSWCGCRSVDSPDDFWGKDRSCGRILGWPVNQKDVWFVRRPTLPQPGPGDIHVGDLLELAPWGRWALHVRDNYGKNSREWMPDGGLFLVIQDMGLDYSLESSTDIRSWELYEPATNSWSTYSMKTDGSWRSAVIIRHVPADSDEVRAITKP